MEKINLKTCCPENLIHHLVEGLDIRKPVTVKSGRTRGIAFVFCDQDGESKSCIPCQATDEAMRISEQEVTKELIAHGFSASISNRE